MQWDSNLVDSTTDINLMALTLSPKPTPSSDSMPLQGTAEPHKDQTTFNRGLMTLGWGKHRTECSLARKPLYSEQSELMSLRTTPSSSGQSVDPGRQEMFCDATTTYELKTGPTEEPSCGDIPNEPAMSTDAQKILDEPWSYNNSHAQ